MGPSIYLGVQGYGCIRAEDKDRFAHRFRQDDSVCCYAVCNKGRYAIQNRLQEGQAYHLTIRQGTVTQAVLTRPDAQGVINAVSGNSITLDGMHLPCRAVFEIRTRAGGAVVLPCFLTGRIVGSYAQVFGGIAYIRPAPQMYHPPVHGVPGQRTLQNLLRTALMPVGIALYVYGGGWNRQDTGSGNTAKAGLTSSTVRTPAMPTATTAIPRTAITRPAAGTSTAMPVWIARATLAGRCTIPCIPKVRLSPTVTAMSHPPPSLPIRLPKEPGVPFPVRTAATACRSRPRSVPAISSAWTVMCGCASVPVGTAALSSRTLRPRPVKPIVKAAAYSSARSIPRVMQIRIVRLIDLQNALCSGICAGAQDIRHSCCPIRFMGNYPITRIQDCFSGMIFYRIKKVFRNSLRRRFCKLRIENGEWRITQR